MKRTRYQLFIIIYTLSPVTFVFRILLVEKIEPDQCSVRTCQLLNMCSDCLQTDPEQLGAVLLILGCAGLHTRIVASKDCTRHKNRVELHVGAK